MVDIPLPDPLGEFREHLDKLAARLFRLPEIDMSALSAAMARNAQIDTTALSEAVLRISAQQDRDLSRLQKWAAEQMPSLKPFRDLDLSAFTPKLSPEVTAGLNRLIERAQEATEEQRNTAEAVAVALLPDVIAAEPVIVPNRIPITDEQKKNPMVQKEILFLLISVILSYLLQSGMEYALDDQNLYEVVIAAVQDTFSQE